MISAMQAHLNTNEAALLRVQPHQHSTEKHNQTAPRVQKDTALRVPETTATLKPSIANAQPPRRTQPKGKRKGEESSKATTSNLN